MPLVVRATTTNVSGRQKRALPPASNAKAQIHFIDKNQLDPTYLRALKVIDRTRRQPETLATVKAVLPTSQDVKRQKNKKYDQLSSTLTRAGQEAMIKTYEDTLISRLTDIYSSKRIGAALPRLHTATFRHRLPPSNVNQTRVANIRQAQLLIDNLNTNNPDKESILRDYVKWQQQWTKN